MHAIVHPIFLSYMSLVSNHLIKIIVSKSLNSYSQILQRQSLSCAMWNTLMQLVSSSSSSRMIMHGWLIWSLKRIFGDKIIQQVYQHDPYQHPNRVQVAGCPWRWQQGTRTRCIHKQERRKILWATREYCHWRLFNLLYRWRKSYFDQHYDDPQQMPGMFVLKNVQGRKRRLTMLFMSCRCIHTTQRHEKHGGKQCRWTDCWWNGKGLEVLPKGLKKGERSTSV